MQITRSLLVATIALRLGALAWAQPTRPALPPEAHQFDFWLGEWAVTMPDGKAAGTSRIESIADGAGLLENWSDADGTSGKSLNVYNTARRQWQQFWVGSGGGVLELAGGVVHGQMVLTGVHEVQSRPMTERIAWTPHADGSVRQLWEQSTDGGKSWRIVFDGLYKRTKLRAETGSALKPFNPVSG